MAMNPEQLDRYIRRCQKSLDEIDEETPYEWKVFGTLKFRYFLGHSKSRRTFYRWLAEIRKPVLPHFLNWFAVIAHDRWNNDIRIHALIGGSQISLQPGWILRWNELGGGDAALADYRPGPFLSMSSRMPTLATTLRPRWIFADRDSSRSTMISKGFANPQRDKT
jgi:hypothetical protein